MSVPFMWKSSQKSRYRGEYEALRCSFPEYSTLCVKTANATFWYDKTGLRCHFLGRPTGGLDLAMMKVIWAFLRHFLLPQEARVVFNARLRSGPLEHHYEQMRIRGAFTSAAVQRFNERCLKKRENAIPNLPDPSVEEQLPAAWLAPFHCGGSVMLMMCSERLLKENVFTLLRLHYAKSIFV